MAKSNIMVQAGPETGKGRVAIMEIDDRHPSGQAFVFEGGEPQEVYPTREVNFRLREELLEEVRDYSPRSASTEESQSSEPAASSSAASGEADKSKPATKKN